MELLRLLLALAGTGTALGLALLPYVPHVPTVALPGKLTATTFTLERPNCIFEQEAEAPDAVWLVVAFANASSLSTIDPLPVHRSSTVVVITSILASLGAVLAAAVLSAVGSKAWGSLCRRDSGTSTHRSYRTHHIPPALPRPPGCRCTPPGLGCFAPRPPAPCPAE
ncbi:uncharacterized protein [Melopsittacus undulatus]|uniref:uncharacterized protein n=1 Tax=Melopsittacus undulatus TaxID=13146 RepID=UPI00146B9277|nr:uncharacterized protein LOC101868961 [Melopsittacus undulatus]